MSAYATLLEMRDRWDIRVFCPNMDYPRWAQPKNHNYYRPDYQYQPEGLAAEYFPVPGLPLVSRPLNGSWMARRAYPRVAAFRPDIVLSYTLYPEGYAAVEVARKLGVPSVVCAIGSDVNRIPDSLSRWLTRRAVSQASYFFSVSEDLRQTALARLGAQPDRSRSIRNGCDLNLFRPRPAAEVKRELKIDPAAYLIVFAGWLSPTKGVPELLEAFTRFAGRHPEAHLACLGYGPLEELAKQQLAAAGLAARVHFPGWVSRTDTAQWFAACDLFCLPSHAEGCPNAVLEALCAGRPVVATKVGGIPELVDRPEKGILVPVRQPAALEEALERAYAHPWDRDRIVSLSARTWRQVADDTDEMLRGVLARAKEKRS